jgi:hypothetical protein
MGNMFEKSVCNYWLEDFYGPDKIGESSHFFGSEGTRVLCKTSKNPVGFHQRKPLSPYEKKL